MESNDLNDILLLLLDDDLFPVEREDKDECGDTLTILPNKEK